jgi:hypothetical protein
VLERVLHDAARARLAVAVLVEREEAVDAPPVRLAPRRLVAPERVQQRAVAQHLRLGELAESLPVGVLIVRMAVPLPKPALPTINRHQVTRTRFKGQRLLWTAARAAAHQLLTASRLSVRANAPDTQKP